MTRRRIRKTVRKTARRRKGGARGKTAPKFVFESAKRNFIAGQIPAAKYPVALLATISDAKIFRVMISNNKIKIGSLLPEFSADKHSRHRMREVLAILHTLVKTYKIHDTEFLMNVSDVYFSKADVPVFNFSVPKNKPGFIFPNYEILNAYSHRRNSYGQKMMDIDTFAEIAKAYHPEVIHNDMYFAGSDNTNRATHIRANMAREEAPFDINLLTSTDPHRPMETMKDHRFVLDIPGWKPWSGRLKFMFLLDRLPVRISLYNPENGEESHLRQYFDFIFVENVDYVHLLYPCDYTKPIPESLYNTIIADLRKVYDEFNAFPEKYDAMVENIARKRKYIDMSHTLGYLRDLLNTYTKTVIVS